MFPGFGANRKPLFYAPSQKLKQLPWEKMSRAGIENTIWARAIDDKALAQMLKDDGVWKEMEQDFKAKEAKQLKTRKKAALKSVLKSSEQQRIGGSRSLFSDQS